MSKNQKPTKLGILQFNIWYTSNQVEEIMGADKSEVGLTDSSASRHLTFRRECLTDYRSYKSDL